ncbi:hypothetical protein HGM15179_018825 [Zosterops borbonicus]|uniref:Uncharacterized protein n=1 Tax=Zosterops borbonicus TaxID=364589 RepID=A0A8K1DAZ5_9PASS|nr:hypothetical protein HGM15179_018825 [Zosterops borbonicus]
MAHSSRMDFYFTATQDLISILVEDPEDDQISTPKEESRKILGILGMSFILTRVDEIGIVVKKEFLLALARK